MARILVIDDDPHLLQMLGLMLERAGHEMVLAADGQQGLDLAAQSPPDLAIVDVMMPEMSGHDVIRRLRATPGTVDTPILTLTARSQSVDREAALNSGANDFMAKPVAPKDLTIKVDEMLNISLSRQNGRVITLFSLRGGAGTSTLAINLAGGLRANQVRNVSVLDLSPNSGHAALQLRVQPEFTWGQLAERSNLTPADVRAIVISHPSGINLLPAPVVPIYDNGLTENQIDVIIGTLCERAEFVVIDAPPLLNRAAVASLHASDLVMLVHTPDVASTQTLSGTLRRLVELGISGRKIHLVLNHPSGQKGLPKSAIERALKRKISFQLPFDPYQARAMAQGTPLTLTNAQSPLPDAMRGIAAALIKAM